MGAICSGKSENPTTIDPPKVHLKSNNNNSVAALPKISYN